METIKRIAQDIKNHGGTAYIVGGFVRDMMLSRESKDIDVEVYGVTPETLESILSRYGKITFCGSSFGVYKLGDYDFTLPRTERKVGVKHTDYAIEVNPFMSIDEATRRRDLTINAMMLDPLTGEIIDLHSGLDHIDQGIIRHIDDETFAEDALRVLRVAQFSARFNFDVHPDTKELCIKLLPEMKHLSQERFMIEIEKILMKAEKPSVAFRFMLETGVLETLFPELHILSTIEQGLKHHPEGNVFNHTMLALDSVPIEQRRLDLMLAILTHDMGKAVVKSEKESEDIIHFYGHAEEGEETIRQFISRFTNETELTETVVTLTKYHMIPYTMKDQLHRSSVRRLALKVNIDDLMVVHLADLSGRAKEPDTSHISRIITVYEEIKNEIKPIIKGRDLIQLGLNPSKQFGVILKDLFEQQLEGDFNTFEEGIKITKQYLQQHNYIAG